MRRKKWHNLIFNLTLMLCALFWENKLYYRIVVRNLQNGILFSIFLIWFQSGHFCFLTCLMTVLSVVERTQIETTQNTNIARRSWQEFNLLQSLAKRTYILFLMLIKWVLHLLKLNSACHLLLQKNLYKKLKFLKFISQPAIIRAKRF